MGGVVALDLVVYGVVAGVGGLGQFRIVRTAIQLILQRAAGDAAAGIDQHLLRAIEGQAGLGGGCSCDRCGRQIYNRKMQLTGDGTGVVAVCGIGVFDVTRGTQLQRLQLFHDSVITGRAIIAVSQRSRHITEGRCIKGALVHHDLNVLRSALGSHIFLLNGKGLAHSIEAVVAAVLRFHDNLACAGIGVVAKLYRVLIIANLQATLGNLNGICRSNGAAGVGVVTAHCHHGCDGFRLDGKGLAHGVGVIALTGQGNSGCASIKVILVLHCIVRVFGQRSLAIFHCQFRNNGAAGISLGSDIPYHAGGQSLGGDVELCLNRPRVVALTGHDHFGRTHIGVVFIGHRVIGSSGQGLLPDIHSNSRLDGAAGVGLGRDRLYHIGSQSLWIHRNFLLGYLGDITLGIGDRDLFVIYSQERSRGKLEVGRLHIFSAAIIVRSSDHHSRLVELLTRGISRMRASLNGNAGQGLLGCGGECLGEDDGSCVRADLGIASGSGHALCEALAGACRQGDLGSVDLIGCRRSGHGRAGGGVALIPLHLAGVAGGCADVDRGVQRLALDRRINRGGHAGNRRLGDGDGSSSGAPGAGSIGAVVSGLITEVVLCLIKGKVNSAGLPFNHVENNRKDFRCGCSSRTVFINPADTYGCRVPRIVVRHRRIRCK